MTALSIRSAESSMMNKWLKSLSAAEAPVIPSHTHTVDSGDSDQNAVATPPRSALDCFVREPPRDVMDQITPQLLTSNGGTFDILYSIPDPVLYPLSQDDLSAPIHIKQKYLRTLSMRDLLWIEEIKVEMELREESEPSRGGRVGRHRRHQDSLWVGQYALVRIRLLIKRACLGLSYIEATSRTQTNFSINFPDLRARRLAFYLPFHPRIVLKDYIMDPDLVHPAPDDYLNCSLEEMTLGFEGAW